MSAVTAMDFGTAVPESSPYHPARLDIRLGDGATALVTADGEIDAVNADLLGAHIAQAVMRGGRLVVDFSGITFFGTHGFSAVHRISVRCAELGARWSLVTGAAVDRVLRICDPQATLPTSRNVLDALGAVGGRPTLAVLAY